MVAKRRICGGVGIPFLQTSDEGKGIEVDLHDWGKVVIVVQGRFIEKSGVMLGKFGQDMAKCDETVEDSSGFSSK